MRWRVRSRRAVAQSRVSERAWAASALFGLGSYAGAAIGVLCGLAGALITYFAVVAPIERSRAIPREEKEIFVLTGTLLWGIMIQELVAYFFTDNPKTVLPLIEGVVEIAMPVPIE